ncbi:Acg family FMN-binding oxidoreductase [Leptospira kanakyensis]|uniref:Nitroreductase n=1 Tax=Leptospira kanakyensis TaxID=2484968 RepID=A0A6N4Q028_9LEPT|nr:hypothetical protein [Leptospira kanakyensis]MCW7480424.1 hypothetical protein [Leptospira kanakyensis]TGK50611.1 hypothetical protein EHQ11_13100 [Leptospira kanakyensis]TGK63788.1 hypothetical protein EHQ16_04920 [Leptospira kanakyensis]TGK69749.1 hypothetical protein EHQ18_13260 [Leptospira kanakyensis]
MKLTRKRFLINSFATGALVSLSTLQKNLYAYGAETSALHRKDPLGFAESLGFTQPLDQILVTALLAPNSHNSQPWKIKRVSDSEFLLFGDGEKQLPEIDSLNRQFFHTQGCFLELAHLTADKLMFDTKITYFPKGKPSSKTFSTLPVAKFEIFPKSKCVHDFLFSGVPDRRMNRSVYSGEFITNEEINDLKMLMGPTKHKLLFVNDPKQLETILPILDAAFAMETNRIVSNELNRKWFRVSKEDIYQKRDGLTLEGNGLSGIKLWFAKTFFVDLSKEAWHSKSSKDAGIQMFQNQVYSSKALVFFITEGSEEERTWIEVGRDFMRVSLACAVRKIAFHTMNQSVEDYPESREFTKHLKTTLGLKPKEQIQLIARMGRSSYEYNSPRRELESFMI